MATTKLETAACLLRAETYKQMREGDARDIALLAVALYEDAIQTEIETARICERLDYLYNSVVKMDKIQRAANQPSSIYPQ